MTDDSSKDLIDLDQTWQRVVDHFGEDGRRIHHAAKVLASAQDILQSEDADPTIVQVAAMLHDVGVPVAERKYGSTAGHLQEKEGEPVARAILEGLRAPVDLVNTVCALVASHHSPGEVKTKEFDVLWDSDWLVNFGEELPEMTQEVKAKKIEGIFRTESGKRVARRTYLVKESGS